MAPLAPIVTQTAPTDAPALTGTPVADLTTDAAEVDPGPFTYATTSTDVSVSGTTLVAAVDLSAPISVDVTVESAGGVSPATTAALTFAAGEETAPEDPYEDNPQIPPPLPEDAVPEDRWPAFINWATGKLRPNARDGVDYAVGRMEKSDVIENVYWNDAVLGPRPDAEIEALAREMARNNPF